MSARTFLRTKIVGLSARLRRLARVDNAFVGLRVQDQPYAPSPAHFAAANGRLQAVERQIEQRYAHLERTWQNTPVQRVLIDIALVERELDRARRLFGMFFEVFAQRGTSFAPSLSAHDVIAHDCYTAVRQSAPRVFTGRMLKPVCYMEHGYSPATMRRGIALHRLLGESNPFPLIRIPWDREHPWQSVFMHEVAHNLQADLGIWQENQRAVWQRVLTQGRDRFAARIYARWHKEIFADLAAILLGGPAAAWGMAEFLAHPVPRALTYRPGSAHPTAYLRILILAEMLRRMNFSRDARRLTRVWKTFYDLRQGHRLPQRLLTSAGTVIPHVVDEIVYQTRRNLAQRALADIIRFSSTDQDRILAAGRRLAEGGLPDPSLPPRFLVSASAYALSRGRTAPQRLSHLVIERLNQHPTAGPMRARLGGPPLYAASTVHARAA